MMSVRKELGTKRKVRFDLVPKVATTTPVDVLCSRFKGIVLEPVGGSPMLCATETRKTIRREVFTKETDVKTLPLQKT
jgi:hypothetical protein